MLYTELVEITPGVDPGVVEIVECNPDGIIADGFKADDPDMSAAVHQRLLPRTVPLHFGGWAFDPQIFRRKAKAVTVVERDFQYLFSPLQAEFNRPACGISRAQARAS